ncbi:MAG: hypothetical protein IJ677_06615 [Alphaproteobacteria bacterium]|nr:hypothetical protein [Alphaproteobacteria bacterium]
MKISGHKIASICVWWGVLFLLKYNLSAVPNNDLPQFVNSVKIPAPAIILLLEEN